MRSCRPSSPWPTCAKFTRPCSARPSTPANFRRQALASKTLIPTGTCLQGTSHRPPALYRFEASAPSAAPEEQR
ncbi:NrtR DNA-binding winged helix domain-containing protein [Aeromicrobium sp. UC242_57]|uniref:NrtR DNA-binding winged helix domain-containing protein n=1 Tax=Aeromicrobium sp. UC242_57 TaxID=3374624 RepID=UPI0037BB17A0